MKKMNRRITLLAVFLCTMVAGVYAQSDDFGIWTSAEVKKKIFPGFDVSVEGEFRTRDGVDNVDSSLYHRDCLSMYKHLEYPAGYE